MADRIARFHGMKLYPDRLEVPRLVGRGGPIAGAVARVDVSGDVSRRVTATRVLTTGVFALGLRKKKDNRKVFFVVEGVGWSLTVRLGPEFEGRARDFAAKINATARAAA